VEGKESRTKDRMRKKEIGASLGKGHNSRGLEGLGLRVNTESKEEKLWVRSKRKRRSTVFFDLVLRRQFQSFHFPFQCFSVNDSENHYLVPSNRIQNPIIAGPKPINGKMKTFQALNGCSKWERI
jgi:hypothetical protein